MLTYRFRIALALLAALLLTPPATAAAADKEAFASATEAYRQGLEALTAGKTDKAIAALSFAADGGVMGAGLKLAEMFATGRGVEKNPSRAFEYYRAIADRYADISPRHPIAGNVAKAFVALAGYYRTGIEQRGLSPNASHAARLLHHAASYFGDGEAQYQLARMYLTGEGMNRNTRLAVNWLANAARKQHAGSQALLGDLLWRGIDDVERQPLKGLALLSMARKNAAGSDDAEWIEEVVSRAMTEAEPGERELAGKLFDRWRGPGEAAPNVVSAPVLPGETAALESLAANPILPVEAKTSAAAPPPAAAQPPR
ncbi:MAG: tetratricopeptide repeat protein [Pseudomonadota bacterium]|nr:tetratricopeptide repeat protein [Pseudomonadota bacterium]